MSALDRILILPFYMATWILGVSLLLGSGVMVLLAPLYVQYEHNDTSYRHMVTVLAIILWLVLACVVAGLGLLVFRLERWIAHRYDYQVYGSPPATATPVRPRVPKPAAPPMDPNWRQAGQTYVR